MLVIKTCPNCGKTVAVPYKKRNRQGYCSLSCTYAHRTFLPVKTFYCIICHAPFESKRERGYCSKSCAAVGYKGFKHSEETKELMRGLWTEERRAAASIDLVDRSCTQCGGLFKVKAKGKGSEKKLCSTYCHTEWLKTDNNPLKTDAARAAISAYASNRPAEVTDAIGRGVSKAWADGKFEGVKVGCCDWYEYVGVNGKKWKVQGTWELAFIHWLYKQRLRFAVHRGRIPYTDLTGTLRNWYPDFYVSDWGQYVDVKSEHFYVAEKFDRIRECNPDISVRLLFLGDLEKLGVEIYDKGNTHQAYLKKLIRRFRVQPGVGKS